MRTTKWLKAINALALFLIFSVIQVSIQVSLAEPGVNVRDTPAQTGGELTGSLLTKNNQPILVNDISLKSGGTLLTGATIDVPDGVSATVKLGPLGQLDIAPNTKVILEFSNGVVKVKLIQGCVVLRTKQGTDGTISTDEGIVAHNEPDKDRVADVCFPRGAPAAIVNEGAAAKAGAGVDVGGDLGGGGLFGLGEEATYFILFGAGGGALALVLLNQGDNQGGNPSNSALF